MINLFDKFDNESQDFLFSQRVAKFNIPTVVINDDGNIPDDVDSPMKEYCNLVSNRKPVYFDDVKIPRYWRNVGKGDHATIYDLDRVRAIINYQSGNNERLVKSVQWFSEDGKTMWVDGYSKHGQLFSKTYYADNAPVLVKYLDRKGQAVITKDLRAGDVFLNYKQINRHFPSLSAFVKYYLEEKHYNLDHVLYNTLDKSMGTSLLLPIDQGEDVLFWHEKLADELPGNMNVLTGQDTRTKHIVFQDYRDWQTKQSLIPEETKADFRYLGMIYPHSRGNKMRPQAVIFTNSDQVIQLETLVKLMPNVEFHVAALTLMSSKLLSVGKYKNVHMYPSILPDKAKELMEKCDLYFDINQGNEILDAVRGAFERNMLILGFNDTLHQPKFVAQQNVFTTDENGVKSMAQQALSALVNPKLMEKLIDTQRQEASEVKVEDYKQAFGELFNG